MNNDEMTRDKVIELIDAYVAIVVDVVKVSPWNMNTQREARNKVIDALDEWAYSVAFDAVAQTECP